MHDYVEVYRDKSGEHRWRYRSANGNTLADSAEGYKNMTDLMRALGTVTDRTPTIVETKGVAIDQHSIRVVVVAP